MYCITQAFIIFSTKLHSTIKGKGTVVRVL